MPYFIVFAKVANWPSSFLRKRKMAEGRLRQAEEDAGIIEQRAAETSVELIRAGNQLINLEIKEKALNEQQKQMNKVRYRHEYFIQLYQWYKLF